MTRTVKAIMKTPSEDQEQMKLVTWMERNNILFYAIPNGGFRNMLEAIKLKKTGVRSGIPDICVPIAASGKHGLYIEMKRIKGSKVSENQIEWINKLKQNGYSAEVARGAEEAIEIVKNYLAG